MDDLIQLKIVLNYSKPTIWRRILVHKKMSLEQLHLAIQYAMSWFNEHLHEFEISSQRFKAPNPFLDIEDDEDDYDIYSDYRGLQIKDLPIDVKKKFTYTYDFGDNWVHTIVVEKFLSNDQNLKHPICIGGEMNCPPEDCGGIYGYYNLLEILNDKNHPEREEILDWLDEDFDPEYFDIEEVNKYLALIEW